MKNRKFLFIALIVSFISLIFTYTPFYQRLELASVDFRYRLRSQERFLNDMIPNPFYNRPRMDPHLGIVAFDLDSLKSFGRWPWTRDKHAILVNILNEVGASMIGFDVFFNEPQRSDLSREELDKSSSMIKEILAREDLSLDRKLSFIENSMTSLYKPYDQKLAESARRFGNVFFGFSLLPTEQTESSEIHQLDLEGVPEDVLSAMKRHSIPLTEQSQSLPDCVSLDAPLPIFSENCRGVGFAQVLPDMDGTVRHYPTMLRFKDRVYFSMPLLMYLHLKKLPLDSIKFDPGRGIILPHLVIPTDKRGLVLLDWVGKYQESFPTFPYRMIREVGEWVAFEEMKKLVNDDPQWFQHPFETLAPVTSKEIAKKSFVRDNIGVLQMAVLIQQYLDFAPDYSPREIALEQGVDPEKRPELYKNIEYYYNLLSTNRKLADWIMKNPDGSENEAKKTIPGLKSSQFYSLKEILSREPLELHKPLIFLSLPRFSKSDKRVTPSRLKGMKLVAGLTATGTFDFNPMPHEQRYPMVGSHPTLLNSLLTNQFLIDRSSYISLRQGDMFTILWLILPLLGSIVGLSVPYFRPIVGFIFAVLLGVLATVINFTMFSRFGILADLLAPIVTIFSSYLVIILIRFILEQRDKFRIKGIFSRFVSPDYVNLLVESPEDIKLGGELKELTIYFSDLAGFTTICEQLKNEPHELVSILNEYMDAMTKIIFEYKGTLDKYIGDAIMAFWGAPLPVEDPAVKACWCALDMKKKMLELQKDIMARGYPKLHCRAGVNTGPMVVGNVGSEIRTDYTVLGDAVNLGARLEPANKPFNTDLMIAESTYLLAKDSIIVRPLDILVVKGKSEPIKTYELIAKSTDTLPEKFLELLKIYEEAYHLYYPERKFEDALKLFERCLSIIPDDGPSLFYIEKCKLYISSPPPDSWQGENILTTK